MLKLLKYLAYTHSCVYSIKLLKVDSVVWLMLCMYELVQPFLLILKFIFTFAFSSRQQEIEEKLIEEETARRVEELVAKRVEEELEKRKDEIEREVLRRVEEAKRIMEKQLLEELERQRQAELAAQKAREVTLGRLESRDSPWQNFQCRFVPPVRFRKRWNATNLIPFSYKLALLRNLIFSLFRGAH